MKSLVLPFNDPQATLDRVGGKGASLTRLVNAGLPVPGGLHITTAAYKQFVAENDLQPRILAALQDTGTAQPTTLETASASIRTLFVQSPIPSAIADAIRAAYRALADPPLAVAVRSSATAEDLPDASFAGQQDTYLNIRGEEAVLDAVRRCWASLWTARAIGYRARQGIDPDSVALAVVVQTLVFAEAAGIMFTANPLNGRRDQILINAAWGLGEAIVGGLVTPDTYTVDKNTGQTVTREIADKQVMTVRTETGTAEQPVPADQRTAQVLGDAQIADLARLGVQIEVLYQAPMDIEWCLTGGQFYIVQARPITALPEPEPVAEWTCPPGDYMRGSVVDLMGEPLTPLFATLGITAYNAGMARMVHAWMSHKSRPPEYRIITVNHYAYLGIHFSLRDWWTLLTAMIRVFPHMLRTLESRWRDEARPRYAQVAGQWSARSPETLSAAELLAGVREIADMMVDYMTTLQTSVMGSAGGAEGLFTLVYDRLCKRPGNPPAPTLVLGYESQPIRLEKELYDLAQWAQTQPPLAAYLTETPAAQVGANWDAPTPPSDVSEEAWGEWRNRLDTLLHRYGHSIYTLDFGRPIPADDPTTWIEMLKNWLTGIGHNPHKRQARLAAQRETATAALLTRLKGWKRKLFLKTLGWAQWLAPLREDAIADAGLGYPTLRRLLHELGRRMVAAGALAQAQDIFWLEENEAVAAAATLDRGENPANLQAAVAARRKRWQQQRRLSPPPKLPPGKKFAGIDISGMLPATAESQQGSTLQGIAASPGQVTAPACVLHGPEDFGQMRPGAVLVAATTTPAWTPLFAMASAVVTDIGGPLSHGSIVAREYGIPAVMGTGVATRRIQNGQTIIVDGSAGKVVLHTSKAVPASSAIEWTLPNPKGQYMHASVADLLPNPVSPLFETLSIPAIARGGVKKVLQLLTHSEPILPDYIVTLNSYVYINASYTLREWWWILTRMILSMPRMLREAIPLWRDQIRPRYVTTIARWQDRAPETLSLDELWAGIQELNDAAMLHFSSLLVATTGASAGAEMLFTRVYDKLIQRKDDPAATVFLMGYDSTPIQAEKSLYDLAEWVRTYPDLADYLLNTPTAQVFRTSSELRTTQLVEEFKTRLQTHLNAYGHLIYDLDFASLLPCDDPAPLLETVKMYLRGEGVNPHERQRATEARREQAVAAVRARLKGLRRWAFDKTLKAGQAMAQVRENALADIGLGYPVLRALLRELGHRFVQVGTLKEAEDIFWLQAGEVQSAIAALSYGESLAHLTENIAQRQTRHAALRQLTPPPMLPPREKYMGIDMKSFTPAAEESHSDRMLKGIAASPGQVTAPACVLHGPEDFGQMRPGAALVAATTTPAWTPLFAMASAVVTDIGGPLSHGSIVAREYGIPAVMGTGVATRRIQSGQTINVDGSAGTVTLRG